METTKRFIELEPGDANFLVPPNAQRLMTGVSHAYQTRGGLIVLVYVDQSTAERHSTKDLVQDFGNFFEVVSFVQDN